MRIGIGLTILLVALVSLIRSLDSDGGIIWIGGFIVGGVLIVKGLFQKFIAPTPRTNDFNYSYLPTYQFTPAHTSTLTDDQAAIVDALPSDESSYWTKCFPIMNQAEKHFDVVALSKPNSNVAEELRKIMEFGSLAEDRLDAFSKLHPPERFQSFHDDYREVLQLQEAWARLSAQGIVQRRAELLASSQECGFEAVKKSALIQVRLLTEPEWKARRGDAGTL